jgi:hypothetical protein
MMRLGNAPKWHSNGGSYNPHNYDVNSFRGGSEAGIII